MKALRQWCLLVLLALLGLQVFFLSRIGLMAFVNPQSTAFERSEAWQLGIQPNQDFYWQQQWLPYNQIADSLKRAVIASEDADFIYHQGVQWDALEKAWKRNAQTHQRLLKRKQTGKTQTVVLVGGSTITQQLAKNLFLSGERNFLRKGQEFVLTLALELFLSKERILEIYLNSVEWGEGVFGAKAAAQNYFAKPASQLTAYEAARLAVMLPRPKHFEQTSNTAYLDNRARVIMARMLEAQLP